MLGHEQQYTLKRCCVRENFGVFLHRQASNLHCTGASFCRSRAVQPIVEAAEAKLALESLGFRGLGLRSRVKYRMGMSLGLRLSGLRYG